MNTIKFLFVIGILASTVQALEYICSKNAQNTEMIVTIRQEKGDTARKLQAIDILSGETDGCTAKETEFGTILELVIKVSIPARVQTSPTIATSNCYVEKDADTATQVNLQIIQQAFANFSVSTDTVYTVSCDSETAGSPVTELPSGQALIVALTPTVIEALTDSVAVALIDSNGDVVTAAMNVGETVKIQITYTPPTATTATEAPVGIFTHSVIVAGTSDFSGPTAELITPNGCVSTSAMAKPFALTGSMTYDAAASGAATPNNVYVSGELTLAMFDGPSPKNLYIKLQYVAACLTITEEKCADQQLYCTNNNLQRKRRSVNDGSAPNGTITFFLPLNVGNAAGYGSGLASYGSGAFIAQPECRVPELYWIISVVLGVSLLIVMALCVFLALRLRKERGSVDKFIEKQ